MHASPASPGSASLRLKALEEPQICQLTCIIAPELLGRFGNDGVGVMRGEPRHEVCVHIPVVREPAVGQWEGGKECQYASLLLIASTAVSPVP